MIFNKPKENKTSCTTSTREPMFQLLLNFCMVLKLSCTHGHHVWRHSLPILSNLSNLSWHSYGVSTEASVQSELAKSEKYS